MRINAYRSPIVAELFGERDKDKEVREHDPLVMKAMHRITSYNVCYTKLLRIDSLAWGKYKLGECDEAMSLIKQVEAMVGNSEEEVNEHLKAIESCKTKA